MYHFLRQFLGQPFGQFYGQFFGTDFRTVFGTVLGKVFGTNPLNNDFCIENWKMCRKRTNNLIRTPYFRITCPNVSKSKNKSYLGTILSKNNLYTMAREQWFQIWYVILIEFLLLMQFSNDNRLNALER